MERAMDNKTKAMTAKEYLQTIHNIQRKINRLEALRQSIRADLYSIGSPSGHMDDDKVQTTISGDKMIKLVAKVDKVERDIVAELSRLTDAKQRMLQQIEKVPVESYRQLLYDRYVLCQRWEKIALDRDTGVRWIYRMHGKALNAFEKVWNDH